MRRIVSFFILTLACAPLTHAERIVVYGDEWMWSDGPNGDGGGSGFASANDGERFALNVADWLIEGRSGANILLSSTSSFALNGSMLKSILTGAGYSVTYDAGPLTLAQLSAYDAVFVANGTGLNAALLAEYVKTGGNVFLAAGTGRACDDCLWDPFLKRFGLDFGPGSNRVGSPYTAQAMSLPVSGSHPILAGIDHLQYGNGNNVYDINPSDRRSQVIATYRNIGILAVYDGNPAPAAVPEVREFEGR